MMPPWKYSRNPKALRAVLAALVLVLGAATVLTFLSAGPRSDAAASMPSSVPPSGPATPSPASPSPTPYTIPLKADPVRVTVPSAHIDAAVSLLPQQDIAGSKITIPSGQDPAPYWVHDQYRDQPGSNSTDLTLILAHSCKDLPLCSTTDFPFNRLSDPALVSAGTDVAVTTTNGKVCYTVTRVTTSDKENLVNRADIVGTAPLPTRLLLVSCYMDNINTQNIVVIADRASCT
ncbi:MAG: hypothetical protein NVSMB43_18010 [Pseudarthrobacter sp.]